MKDQTRELKAQVEGAIGYGPNSLLARSWQRVWDTLGENYVNYMAGKSHYGSFVDENDAWQQVVEAARYEYEHQQEVLRQGSGTEPPEPPPPEPKPEEEESEEEESEHPAVKLLSERTKARGQALSEFYAFRIGDDTPIRPMRVKLRLGGSPVVKDLEDPNSDLDIREVIILEVQAWVSPEEVARVFRTVRASLLEEEERIQAKPSTLEIGAFAWQEWRRAKEEGRDLPTWAELKRLWLEDHPGDKRIEGHGDFQKYFNRAKEAVFPKYLKTLFPAPPELKAEIEARKARLIRALEGHREK